jgi:long-chain fatty acid transport protein
MKLHPKAIAAAFAASLLAPGLALGAGYGIYEQGAAVLGMAGAGTASVDDASANFFNAAALARLKGPQVIFGGSWLATSTSFAGIAPNPGFGVSEQMKNGTFFPPTVYWASHLKKSWVLGVGVNSPFGLGIEWKDPDHFSDRAYVTKATLRTIHTDLDLAWQVRPTLSIGGGYDVLMAGVELWRISPSGVPIPGGGGAPLEVRAHLKGGYSRGYTGNFGVLWVPGPDWRVGVNYRGKAHVAITDGDADFAIEPTGNPAVDAYLASSVPPKQKVVTELRFPSLLSIGAAWSPAADWTWELDVNRAGWKWFQELPIEFQTTTQLSTHVAEDYRDAWRVSLGASHRGRRNTYRFGYYFDEAAAPVQSVTSLLPDANRHGATLGFSRGFGAWTLDAYNLALFVESRSTDGANSHGFDGVYKSYVNATGASLAYHW